MKVSETAQNALDSVLEQFETGEITETLVKAAIPPDPNAPCFKWTLANRVLMVAQHTTDARGFRQWQQIKRKVKKGSKAIYILAPCFFKVKAEDEETGETEEKQILGGFRALPLFRVQDTQGDDSEDLPLYSPKSLPKLIEVAERFGVSVHYAPLLGDYLGFYSHDRKEITLCTDDERTFWHELAHAAHYRAVDLKPTKGQDPHKEIVAELTAATLCMMYSGKVYKQSYNYIAMYAEKQNLNPYDACMRVLGEMDKVIKEIFPELNPATNQDNLEQ